MPVFIAKDEGVVIAALRTGQVSAALATAPVHASLEPEGLALEPTVRVSTADKAALLDFGFSVRRRKPADATTRSSWAEVVATRPAPEPAPPLPHVLFVCPRARNAELVGSLIRLGCDDIELAFFTDERGSDVVACRAVAPPYFVVLQALGEASHIRAFVPVDRSHRVWLELGYEHPLAEHVVAPDSQLLLVPGRGDWRRLPDGPWVPLAKRLDVTARSETRLAPHDAQQRYSVTLTLTRSSRTLTPSLWVLRGDAVSEVDRLVQSLPAAELERLAFASLVDSGQRVVALRARRVGRQAAPELQIEAAEAFASYPMLENLHVPLGTTVAPPLRIERIRELLAPEAEALVWLSRLAIDSAEFRVQSAPHAAFAPLSEWVDHVASEHAGALERWVGASVFEFEAFTAEADTLDVAERAKRGPRARVVKPTPVAEQPEPDDEPLPNADEEVEISASPLRLRVRALQPSERALELGRIESELLDHEGAPDAPEQIERWIALAVGYGADGRAADSSLSWAHAVWETAPGAPFDELVAQWLAAEREQAAEVTDARDGRHVRVVAAEAVGDPASTRDDVRAWLRQHDRSLDARTYWLAWDALAGATGDELARVRATDAVLQRLRGGLTARDIPAFVRADSDGAASSGGPVEGLLADELETTLATYYKTKRKRSTVEASVGLTDGYVHFLFAWGFARLARDDNARATLERADELHAEAGVDGSDPVHHFLRESFRDRVEQALEGLPTETPMSAERLGELEALERYARYKVDRLRQASVILDSTPHLDPFASFGADRPRDGLQLEQATPEHLAAAVDELLATEGENRSSELMRATALARVLPSYLAVPRLEPLLGAATALEGAAQVPVLEAVAMIASRCEHIVAVATVCERFEGLLASDDLADPSVVALALSRLSSTLRRSGLATRVQEIIAGQFDAIGATDVDATLARLQLATSMASFGDRKRLEATTEAALQQLGDRALASGPRLALSRGLMLGLGNVSAERAVAGARALTKQLKSVTDSFNTNSHYCLSVLGFVESLVLGLARPDLSTSERARRFIDNDEHRIRQRLFATSDRSAPS